MTFDGQPYYRNRPHFTVGHVDQWGEQGYFIFEGKIFNYTDDRKSGYYSANETPFTPEEFIQTCKEDDIVIPPEFLSALKE